MDPSTNSPTPSPTPSPTSSSVSLPTSSHPNSENDPTSPANDDKRPHAPVAKTLNKQEQKHSSPNSNEVIPNLLHSGKFPPPPRSPSRQHTHSMSISPPPILMDPLSPTPLGAASGAVMSPSYVPACPPGTPYTPYTKPAVGSLPSHILSTSPTLAAAQYKLGHRPSSPPISPPFPPPDRPPTASEDHYITLLNQYQSTAISQEKTRVASQIEHEKSYTTLEEFRHVLARERRHSMVLVQELAYHKFCHRYQSCAIYSEAEQSEEAKVNLLIKNMEGIIKSKDEEKCKTVMELEREEERMINVLMERLECVKREKEMLERKIYGCGVSSDAASRFESMEGVERGDREIQQSQVGQPEMQEFNPVGQSARESEARSEEIAECEEEEEEDGNQDILEDRFHDPEMEMELDRLLEKKGVDK